MAEIKIETKHVSGVGNVLARIQQSRRADGSIHLRMLQESRYVESGRPVENEHLDAVRQAFNAH